jgi:hypothetical protein
MEKRKKPDGGFRFIGAYELLGVYFAYKANLIRWYDLRVWFACQEAVARRCCAKKGVPARYSDEEIQKLVGGAGCHYVRGALKRLERAGLLSLSSAAITFAKSPDEIRIQDLSGFWMMVEDFGHANRKVPVPRRTLRAIAAGTRKVETATMLGHVLRCCYFRRGEYSSEGSCSASWISRVFGLDERNVKILRKQLLKSRWLLSMKSDAWHRQRFGGRAIVNPEWAVSQRSPSYVITQTRCDDVQKQRSPRIGPLEAKRSPLLILKENSFGFENQKPAFAADRPTGFSRTGPEQCSRPSLRRVVLDDLRDTSRTMILFEEAVSRKIVANCEADRLKVVAAAQRAMRVGTKNPCGLFTALLYRNLWAHITLDDEDAARRNLKLLRERDG